MRAGLSESAVGAGFNLLCNSKSPKDFYGKPTKKRQSSKGCQEGKKKMNENESLTTYRNRINDFQKRRTSYSLIRHTETYLLVCWSPVLRWHQLFSRLVCGTWEPSPR